MSTGFSFPWEKAAMRGEELPDGLSLPDQMAYTALRNTYRAYYDKTISLSLIHISEPTRPY